MICAPRFAFSLAALIYSTALCGGTGVLAADLPLPPYIRLPAPTAMPPPIMDYKSPRMSEEAVQATPSIEQHNSRSSDSVASLKPAPLLAAPTKPVIAAPLPALAAQQVASNDFAPKKAQQAEPSSASTGFMSSLGSLSTLVLILIAALNGFFVLPIILRAFDALLAAPLECDVADAPLAHETNATFDDLHDFAHSELTAADIRKQTEVLRALKDTLDAELESVRATIRRERTRAEAKDTL
jgi:hypothetical protein